MQICPICSTENYDSVALCEHCHNKLPMKLTNVIARAHHAFEITTPGEFLLPTEQSFIILQIAVPPKEDVATSDVFQLTVGNDPYRAPAFEHPLKPLMDMYRSELKSAAEAYLRVEAQFSVILDAILDGKGNIDPDAFRKLHVLHRHLRFGHDGQNKKKTGDSYTSQHNLVPQSHAAVGVLLARAILVAPRQQVWVRCKHGSKVTVYLGGLLSRSVND